MAITELLETSPLAVFPDDAARVAHDVYGLICDVESLPGERDRNFLLSAEGESYVLKIANPAEQPAVLDMQQRVLLHVRRWDPELRVARPMPTQDGELVGATTVAGQDAAVTLATYLDGTPLEHVAVGAGLRHRTVETLASLDLAMRTFHHQELNRPLAWDLRRLPQLRSKVECLEADRKSFVDSWLTHFENRVEPRLRQLNTQAIHNDFNPANLLLAPGGSDRLAGIVDFGDMTLGTRVEDLAIAASYQCLDMEDVSAILLAAVTAYTRQLRLSAIELDLLPDLAISRLVQSIVISAWRAGLHPDNRDYILIHAEPVWEALQRLIAIDLDQLRRDISDTCEPSDREALSTSAALEARRHRLAPGLRLTYDTPLHAVSAESVWITGRSGGRHLDAYNNVAHVGHGQPEVVAAMAAQAARLNTNTRYVVDEVNAYADRLVALLPAPLDTVFFANSGGEANDLAWRIARTITGRQGMIITDHAYHGSTYLTMATSPEELGLDNLEPWVATIAPARPGVSINDEIAAALDQLSRAGEEPAAFACDTVFSSDGIYDPEPGYLAGAYAAMRRAGGLCIADEVQAGLGRVGERVWGFAADDVVPDIVTLGKPMGNGHPIAAVITTTAIAEEFSRAGYYFSTFAGNPVSAAVGMKVLDVMERERLPQQAEVIGRYLRSGLRELEKRSDVVGDVRGPGLFLGVEIVDAGGSPAPAAAESIQNSMRDRRVLIGRTGPSGNVLKIRPPLVFTEEHSDLLLETLDNVLSAW